MDGGDLEAIASNRATITITITIAITSNRATAFTGGRTSGVSRHHEAIRTHADHGPPSTGYCIGIGIAADVIGGGGVRPGP